MQIGVSVVAVVVKTERLAVTFVVSQCREMDVKEEQRVAIKFCCKVGYQNVIILSSINISVRKYSGVMWPLLQFTTIED